MAASLHFKHYPNTSLVFSATPDKYQPDCTQVVHSNMKARGSTGKENSDTLPISSMSQPLHPSELRTMLKEIDFKCHDSKEQAPPHKYCKCQPRPQGLLFICYTLLVYSSFCPETKSKGSGDEADVDLSPCSSHTLGENISRSEYCQIFWHRK